MKYEKYSKIKEKRTVILRLECEAESEKDIIVWTNKLCKAGVDNYYVINSAQAITYIRKNPLKNFIINILIRLGL